MVMIQSESARRVLGMALAVTAIAALAAVPATAGQASVLVRVVISGEVLPLQLATVGQVVKQGDPLVFLRGTTSGAAVPAAVASVDGRVLEVRVRPGDRVNIGDVVAVIQAQ
jgi:biotin carboxyl carrier protein